MIEEGKFYTVAETAEILSLHKLSIINRCKSWELECNNISKTKRCQFRIKWSNILNFLNNN